jgi:hypothetical protein
MKSSQRIHDHVCCVPGCDVLVGRWRGFNPCPSLWLCDRHRAATPWDIKNAAWSEWWEYADAGCPNAGPELTALLAARSAIVEHWAGLIARRTTPVVQPALDLEAAPC